MSNNKSSNTKCCKVCRDSGKPDSIVTSHFVKDTKNGVIVCPTLLATVCRYCKQTGHTVKYCTSVKNKPKASTPKQTTSSNDDELKVKKVTLEINARVNRYGSLSDESDSDTEDAATLLPFPQPPVLQRQSATNIPKRWVDYESDSDIEQEI